VIPGRRNEFPGGIGREHMGVRINTFGAFDHDISPKKTGGHDVRPEGVSSFDEEGDPIRIGYLIDRAVTR